MSEHTPLGGARPIQAFPEIPNLSELASIPIKPETFQLWGDMGLFLCSNIGHKTDKFSFDIASCRDIANPKLRAVPVIAENITCHPAVTWQIASRHLLIECRKEAVKPTLSQSEIHVEPCSLFLARGDLSEAAVFRDVPYCVGLLSVSSAVSDKLNELLDSSSESVKSDTFSEGKLSAMARRIINL